MAEFSGGQRSKIAFIKLLLSKPDIMLLDEPTNHLDMAAVEWLEQYLKSYNRAVVVVSHDRMFLDNVADVVYEIEYGTAKRYPGNYSHFVETKQADYEKQLKDYTLQQQEIKRLETLVERGDITEDEAPERSIDDGPVLVIEAVAEAVDLGILGGPAPLHIVRKERRGGSRHEEHHEDNQEGFSFQFSPLLLNKVGCFTPYHTIFPEKLK